MATATAILKKDYKRKDGTYPLKIRLSSGNQIVYHNTDYYLKSSQFVNGEARKHGDATIINSVVSGLLNQAKKYFADCAISNRPVNLKNVFKQNKSVCFQDYLIKRADQYKEKGKVIMWQKLSRYVKELNECFKSVYFDEIDIDKLRTFESYLLKNGNHNNTIAKKFRTLRQMFNDGMREGLFTGINPFEDYKIKTFPVKKEKLTEAEIEKIEQLKLDGPYNDARNLFLFSYYAKGSRFENCIFLQRKDIYNGRIFFHTNKGKKYLSVEIHRKLKDILDQYPEGEFIFPYIKSMPKDEFEYRSVKDTANTIVNRYLKVVSGLAGIKPITFHIARHSIAMNSLLNGVSHEAIKEGLGHSSIRTTEIYLAQLNDTLVDSEFRKVYKE